MENRKKITPQDAESTRNNIVRTAEKIFAEKGYTGARVAEIAENVGMDKGLIFYYFGSKQGLYAHILEDFFERAEPLLDQFLKKRGENTHQIDLERFMVNTIDFIQRNRNPLRILFREFLDGATFWKRSFTSGYSRFSSFGERIIPRSFQAPPGHQVKRITCSSP